MKKKNYIKPEVKVYHIEAQTILANSTISTAKDEDYNDEKVNEFIESDGFIYADYRLVLFSKNQI